MSLKKTLLIIGSITGILLVILSVLLAKSFEEPVPDVGIFRPDIPDEYQEPPENNQRTEMPIETIKNINNQINGYLSAGKFEELDECLKEYLEHFTDTPDCEESQIQKIDKYRADLTFIRLMKENDLPIENWSFENPDVLAAAYAYLPISKKYLAPLNRTSPIFPAARTDIQLTERQLSKKETYSLLQSIVYDGDFKVNTIKLYDVKINDHDVELLTMIDPETRLWVLYEARVGWKDALTCAEVDEMIEIYGVEDIDRIVLM